MLDVLECLPMALDYEKALSAERCPVQIAIYNDRSIVVRLGRTFEKPQNIRGHKSTKMLEKLSVNNAPIICHSTLKGKSRQI